MEPLCDVVGRRSQAVSVSRRNWFVALPATIDLPPAPEGVTALDALDHHVTVAFLGPVSEAAAMAAWRATRFDLAVREGRLGEVLALGASAITVRVDDRALEQAITCSRDAITEAAGARRDDRDALPHVTLARVSARATVTEHAAALAWARGLHLEGTLVRLDRIALYTSATDGGARRYRIVDVRPLP
jgi:2'-5' RNA ligase